MIIGWYYLHNNGSLIYKRETGGTAADIRESDFARAMWPLDTEDRSTAWTILVEAAALGADAARIKELARLWRCDNNDAEHYAKWLGARLFKDGSSWCATRGDFVNLQTSAAGFGDTALAAIAELAKALGYRGGKMWNATLKSLCVISSAAEQQGTAKGASDA